MDDEVARGADLYLQRGAELRVDRADLVGECLPVTIVDRGDLEAFVVQRDRRDTGLRIDVERGGAGEALGRHVDIEVKRKIGDARFERFSETVRIDRIGSGEYRRDGPGDGISLRHCALLAGRKQHGGRGEQFTHGGSYIGHGGKARAPISSA